MLIQDLFVSDVTRDIPPVVYFHEQTPEKLAAEVSEYIITGGWPDEHPEKRRVPEGIHEQYVKLLTGIVEELDKPGGPSLPNAWISGFYGSGKSSFAKLLGLALDGVALPDGSSLAEAWLRQNTTIRAQEMRAVWDALRKKIDPISVVFDVGSTAQNDEHVHSAAITQIQRRLGYSSKPMVADFELSLEREGEWNRFVELAEQELQKPWAEVKDTDFADEDFSLVMSVMFPHKYTDPMSWFISRAGTHVRASSPEEAVAAIRDMLKFRSPNATLFVVIDEVSQYVLSHKDRVDRLRAFASALGSTLKGRVWLLALGQQKLDESADESFLGWAKDRFPPQLRVHLASTNIRDVVHKRLLRKKEDVKPLLHEAFEKNRASLKLFAYGCESITAEEFVETYPMLPGHIDLLLQVTSALRSRSSRAQGDDQAIRGLLQMLGELFREKQLAREAFGALVTLDKIYDVQHTALGSDVQDSMARVLNQCADDASGWLVRVAKCVALLELIQETVPTTAALVAQCLYDRLDRGSLEAQVSEALEDLRRRNLLGYSEKLGYKIQSSAGEEWERMRRDIPVGREKISQAVQESLKSLVQQPGRPQLSGRPFAWSVFYSDSSRASDQVLQDPRTSACVTLDFRFIGREERGDEIWVGRSMESHFKNRLIWTCGDSHALEDFARELVRSRDMVARYHPRRETLNAAQKLLLQEEANRSEDLEARMKDMVAKVFMAGRVYFQARAMAPGEYGNSFATALAAMGSRILPELFPHFIATNLDPSELAQLLEPELSGLSPKLLTDELGILELDNGRYVPTCKGVVPQRVADFIKEEVSVSGTALLAHLGGPPFGYTDNIIKACVAGLLRAGMIRIQTENGTEITAIRDAGVREVFDSERTFRRANFMSAGEDDIGFQARARICKFFETHLKVRVEREDHAIADAVASHFPAKATTLRTVFERLNGLPDLPEHPPTLVKLDDALEACIRVSRQTKRTVQMVRSRLDALNDGMQLLNRYDAELTDASIAAVRDAARIRDNQLAQLLEQNLLPDDAKPAAERISQHLATQKPWLEIAALEPDLKQIKDIYAAERRRLILWQAQEANAVRAQIKGRKGFSTLTADQSHQVLSPIAQATTPTTEEAVAPTLDALKDPFTLALQRAEEQSIERLDEIINHGVRPIAVRVPLSLRNREVSNEAEVEALLDEIRQTLLEQIRAGGRVRIV